MNPWEVLGIKNGATQDEIKAAYRKKAKETHPDHGGSAEAFQQVRIAYEYLTSKRSWRTEYGEMNFDPAPPGGSTTIITSNPVQTRHDYIFCPGCNQYKHMDEWNLLKGDFVFHFYGCPGAISRRIYDEVIADLKQQAERRRVHVDYTMHTAQDSPHFRKYMEWQEMTPEEKTKRMRDLFDRVFDHIKFEDLWPDGKPFKDEEG